MTEINTTLREYQLGGYLKAIYLLLAGVLITGAGLLIKLATSPNGRPFSFYFLFASALLVLLALFLVLVALRSRLVLVGDWIEIRSGFRTFRANRNEIEGSAGCRTETHAGSGFT